MTTDLYSAFLHLEDALAAHGVPRSSEAWLREVRRFYEHPTARRWVACVGRGGGKNLVGIKCDLTEVIFGDFAIPPGERHYHVHTSENRTEAEKTLAQATEYLRFLRVDHSSTSDTISLNGSLSARGIKVLANRIGANSGFRSTGGTTQESAKWNDDGSNPAEEVVTSWSAQMVTHQGARTRHFSTPMGRDGFFYNLFDEGEGERQIVTQGPTWTFNPSVTEAQCRALATSDRVFQREYQAEPQAGALSAFDPDAIDRAFKPRGTPDHLGRPIVVIDPSSGRKDAWTWCVVRQAQTGPASWLRFERVDGLSGSFWSTVSASDLVDRIATIAADVGAREVHADQRESFALASAFQAKKLGYVVHTWTATSKTTAVERVRRWLADGSVELPEHERLRRELLRFEERITPAGGLTFAGRGSGHDDYVSLLITAAMAEQEDAIASARASTRPISQPRGDLRWTPDVWGNGGGRGF